jgi:NADH-quinone oxidoreductase subunit I
LMPPHPMYPGSTDTTYYKGEVPGSHPSQESNV